MKRLILKRLSQLRRFMQEEVIAQLQAGQSQQEGLRLGQEGLRLEYDRLRAAYERLAGATEAMRGEQERLRAEYERLRLAHEHLSLRLDRMDLFDQTARTIEEGLLSLALQRVLPDHLPVEEPQRPAMQ